MTENRLQRTLTGYSILIKPRGLMDKAIDLSRDRDSIPRAVMHYIAFDVFTKITTYVYFYFFLFFSLQDGRTRKCDN